MRLTKNKKIFVSLAIILLFVVSWLLIINAVQAQSFGKLSDYLDKLAGQTKDPQGGSSPFKKADLPTIVGGILYGVLGFLGVLCLVLIIYAGIKWTMAGGNQETVTSAKQTIKYAIIGVIVVLGAYAASIYILNQVLVVTEPTMTQDIGGPRGDIGACVNNGDCPDGFECDNRQCILKYIGLMGCCVYNNSGPVEELMSEEACKSKPGSSWFEGEICD